MKKTDSQVDPREWEIYEYNIPFGSGVLRSKTCNEFSEADELRGKRWIYVSLLVALRKGASLPEERGLQVLSEDYEPELLPEDIVNAQSFVQNPNLSCWRYLGFTSLTDDLDLLQFDEPKLFARYVYKLKKFYSPDSYRIILDANLRILQLGASLPEVHVISRIPIQPQPKLIQFFSPEPWLEYGVFKKSPRLRELDSSEHMDMSFEYLYSKMEEWGGPTNSYEGVIYLYADYWRDLLMGIWDLFFIVDERAKLGKYDFVDDILSLFPYFYWDLVERGCSNKRYISGGLRFGEFNQNRFETWLKRGKLNSLGAFRNLRLLDLRDLGNRYLQRKVKSILEEFSLRCYDALVHELVSKGVTRRCQWCDLPMILNRPKKKFCSTEEQTKKEREEGKMTCAKKYWNKWDYETHGEKRRKHYREEVRKDRECTRSHQV